MFLVRAVALQPYKALFGLVMQSLVGSLTEYSLLMRIFENIFAFYEGHIINGNIYHNNYRN